MNFGIKPWGGQSTGGSSSRQNTRLWVRTPDSSSQTWEEREPIFLYKKAYCGRGEMELFIKGHKTHLHSGRTSCFRFSANQFRLLLTSLAYVLVETIRREHI